MKKLKGDIQQLEEELAEAKAEREATEKVGIEMERFHPPPFTLHPLPPFSILLHLNLVSLSLLFLPLSHPSSPPLLGAIRQEKEAIIIEETV